MLHDVSSQLRILNASLHNALSKESEAITDVKFLPTPDDDQPDEVDVGVTEEQVAQMESAAARLFANN